MSRAMEGEERNDANASSNARRDDYIRVLRHALNAVTLSLNAPRVEISIFHFSIRAECYQLLYSPLAKFRTLAPGEDSYIHHRL